MYISNVHLLVTFLLLCFVSAVRALLYHAELPPVHDAEAPAEIRADGSNERWLISFKQSTSENDVAMACQSFPGHCHTQLESLRVLGVSANDTILDAVRIVHKESIDFIEPDYMVEATQDMSTSSWALDRLDQMDLPLDGTFEPPDGMTGEGVHIYVVDTGVDAAHDDFLGRVGVSADCFNSGNPCPDSAYGDCHGHGTFTAGLAMGTKWGVAKQAVVHPVMVLDCDAKGTMSIVLRGMQWIQNHHPAGEGGVVLMPFTAAYTRSFEAVLEAFINTTQLLVVSAAGNKATTSYNTPGGSSKVLTVGATDTNDNLATFSNFGGLVQLYAPGVNVVGPLPLGKLPGANKALTDSYTYPRSGTSASASLTAGVAALFLQMNPGASPGMVQSGVLAMCKQGGVSGLDESRDNNYLLNMNPNARSISPLAPYTWPGTPKGPPGIPLSGDAFPAYSRYLPGGAGGGKSWSSSSRDDTVLTDSIHPPVGYNSVDIKGSNTQQGMVVGSDVTISHDAGISSGVVFGGIAVLLLVMGIGPPLRGFLAGENQEIAGYEMVPIRETHEEIRASSLICADLQNEMDDSDVQDEEAFSSLGEHSHLPRSDGNIQYH